MGNDALNAIGSDCYC